MGSSILKKAELLIGSLSGPYSLRYIFCFVPAPRRTDIPLLLRNYREASSRKMCVRDHRVSRREMFFDWNASRPIYLGVYVVSPLRRRRLLLVPPKSRKGGDILLLASGIFGNSLGEAVYTPRKSDALACQSRKTSFIDWSIFQ